MPVSKDNKKPGKSTKPPKPGGHLDILFNGPLFLVPDVSQGNVTGVEVFSPCNGHPVGALFLPEVWFTDEELNDPECERWPEQRQFTLLDPHSYTIDLTQKFSKPPKPFPYSGIPKANHFVKTPHRIGGNWEVSVRVKGQISGWGSLRPFSTEGFYTGADAPTNKSACSMHRLTYSGVTGADFCGAAANPRDYFHKHAAKGGTLIVVGEIPYQSSLSHERRAVAALAKLAGLDLHLASLEPEAHKSFLMRGNTDCGGSTVGGGGSGGGNGGSGGGG